MMPVKFYIRFKDKDDIYILNPLYGILDKIFNPISCMKCGANLYIPVYIKGNWAIVHPMEERYATSKSQSPKFMIVSEPEETYIEVKESLSLNQQYHLKQCPNVSFVDGSGYRLIIDKFRFDKPHHVCGEE